MAAKKELIAEMQKLGIEGLHEGMTVNELKGIYADFKKSKLKEERGKERKEVLDEEKKDTKKFRIHTEKGRVVVPDDCRQIDSEDVIAEKCIDKILTVVFKNGPKIRYNIDTHMRIQ